MSKHLYFYLEDLALTIAQRNTLINAVRNYGEENASQFPHRRMQTRTRTDNKAMIFEAVFPDAGLPGSPLSAAHFQQVLATIYNVPAASITFAVTSPSFGQLVTYTYNSTARLRFGVFGGVIATWQQSRLQAIAYLIANLAAWEAAA
jgi:hypothetical protein